MSQKEMHERVMAAFRSRTDIGLFSAVANSVLEPPNPFQPKEKRRPRRGFILYLLLGGFFLGTFVYFNF